MRTTAGRSTAEKAAMPVASSVTRMNEMVRLLPWAMPPMIDGAIRPEV